MIGAAKSSIGATASISTGSTSATGLVTVNINNAN